MSGIVAELSFRIPGAPQGKGRARSSGPYHYTPSKTRAYEAMVRSVFRLAHPRHVTIPAHNPVTLTIIAESVRPPSVKRVAPTVTPDWDNIGKVVSDALNGLAWHDDAQVTDARVIKRYAVTAGVEVLIEWGSDLTCEAQEGTPAA